MPPTRKVPRIGSGGKSVMKKTLVKHQFDFEVGHLVQSPCRECARRKAAFPSCIRDCLLLDQIQTILAAGVSCTRKV
jgi:hypothetical protein